MNIAIIDDDKSFIVEFVKKIEILFPSSIIDTYTCMCEDIHSMDYNLIFLDVLFDKNKSFGYGLSLLNNNHKDTLLIYMSNEEDFVFESYMQNTFFFIRKTNIDADLQSLQQKYKRLLNDKDQILYVMYKGEQVAIPLKKILYIESFKNKVIITSQTGKYEVYDSLKKIQERINANNFYRFNSYVLINFDYLLEIGKDSIMMEDKNTFLYTRGSKKRFLKSYVEYKEFK